MLKVEALSKSFGGLRAVNNVSLSVKEGSITGLIGPNGAGKTTLFALLSGFDKADSGRVLLNGTETTALKAYDYPRFGLARTFQIVQPFAGLTVHENIMVGSYAKTMNRKEAEERAIEVALKLQLHDELKKEAASLTLAKRKRLEIARCLAMQPQIILLDEVLAGLNPSEIRDILPILEDVRAGGVTIFMIEHIMQAVMALCQDIYVLVSGEIIAQGKPQDVVMMKSVQEAYLGASHG